MFINGISSSQRLNVFLKPDLSKSCSWVQELIEYVKHLDFTSKMRRFNLVKNLISTLCEHFLLEGSHVFHLSNRIVSWEYRKLKAVILVGYLFLESTVLLYLSLLHHLMVWNMIIVHMWRCDHSYINLSLCLRSYVRSHKTAS